MICVECGVGMIPDQQWRRSPPPSWAGVKCHRGRGLCSTCYSRASRAGTLLDYERKTVDRESMLDDLVIMVLNRRNRDTATLAQRIGMSKDALTVALMRAARAGDERALEVRSHLPWMREV